MLHLNVPARRQRFVAGYVLPSELGRSLQALQPDVDLGPVWLGLRQWLRLRILTKETMGMPSVAVWHLWREFVGRKGDFADFSRHAFGSEHEEFSVAGIRPPQAAADQMALTWAMACEDEDLAAVHAAKLPILFAADGKAGVTDGQGWLVTCGHETCTAAGSDRCAHHELVGHLPEHLPKQIHFDESKPYALFDRNDNLFFPRPDG